MQNSWGKYMLGELIRVRIDAAHMPEDANRAHADLALPTNVAIAALVPDILQIFDIDIADFPLAQWQLRPCPNLGSSMPPMLLPTPPIPTVSVRLIWLLAVPPPSWPQLQSQLPH